MSEARYGDFGFVGGHPALDFVNTASRRANGELVERIGSYRDLATWASRAGLIGEERGDELAALAEERPRAAAATLRRARELREAAFRLFVCRIAKREPDSSDLARLNRWVRRAPRGGTVHWDGGGFVITEPRATSPLDEPLNKVTHGIVDLLCGEHGDLVSRCEDASCNWLFLDRSPAHARRWCSMADCGNRAKARRHYEKQKAQRA